jgi:hypothetical protein
MLPRPNVVKLSRKQLRCPRPGTAPHFVRVGKRGRNQAPVIRAKIRVALQNMQLALGGQIDWSAKKRAIETYAIAHSRPRQSARYQPLGPAASASLADGILAPVNTAWPTGARL